MKEHVEKILEEIKPRLRSDGGDIEVVSVDEGQGIVNVRFLGACSGCPMAAMTLKGITEEILRQNVPGFKELILVD